jgi:diaminopimelate decarboxylase
MCPLLTLRWKEIMNVRQAVNRLALYPLTSRANEKGHLEIGGCDTVSLAEEFGTPLYVFDELTIRDCCSKFKTEFRSRYPDTVVCYSAKAFGIQAMIKLVKEEGLDLDVASGGEMGIAHSVGFPMKRIHFPGNNKSAQELEMAIQYGIGHIVVDNPCELDMLIQIAGKRKVDILIRLSPGIDAHTHAYNTTGIVDSKFGLTRSTWDKTVSTALAAPSLNVDGLQFHIGSGIFETEPYERAIEVVLDYAVAIKKKHDYEMKILSIGGGFGVQYTLEAVPPTVTTWAKTLTDKINSICRELKLTLPKLIVEPGRAIVAQSGVALYNIGVIKDIPGIRRYVCVDGGMGDNIRHALYGARQEAIVANKVSAPETDMVTIAGRYCEAGDILIEEIHLPPVTAGDVLAVAGSGAYSVPLQSNYNASLRPAIVFVREGKASLVRRRETLEDLTRCDVL